MKRIFILILLVLFVSCGNESKIVKIPDGEKDGKCYANDTCNDGLVCEDGVCVDPNETTGEPNDDATDEMSDSDVVNTDNIIETDETTDESNDDVISDNEENDSDVIEENIYRQSSGSRIEMKKYNIGGEEVFSKPLYDNEKNTYCKFMKHKWEDAYRCYPDINIIDVEDVEGVDYGSHLNTYNYEISNLDDNGEYVVVIRNGESGGKVVDIVIRLIEVKYLEDEQHTISFTVRDEEGNYEIIEPNEFVKAVEKTL